MSKGMTRTGFEVLLKFAGMTLRFNLSALLRPAAGTPGASKGAIPRPAILLVRDHP